jgi:uncharacterized membrane protein YcgQ (UPF0703/DUF1980 family)
MKSKKEFKNIFAGISLLFGIHFSVFFLLGTLAYFVSTLSRTYIIGQFIVYGFFYIGLFQLLYVIPTIIWLKRKQYRGIVKGTIVGAVITVMLNIVGLALWVSSFR